MKKNSQSYDKFHCNLASKEKKKQTRLLKKRKADCQFLDLGDITSRFLQASQIQGSAESDPALMRIKTFQRNQDSGTPTLGNFTGGFKQYALRDTHKKVVNEITKHMRHQSNKTDEQSGLEFGVRRDESLKILPY